MTTETKELGTPENLQSSEKAGFNVMRAFMLEMFGPAYTDKVLRMSRREFAKKGFLAWEPNDANIVADVSPMPEPWAGDWGYRLRFAAIEADGNVCVNQFYVPSKSVPAVRKGGFQELN